MTATVYDWMLAHVERAPHAAAFVEDSVDGARALSWTDLSGLVAGLRGGLRERGVRRGDRIALSLPNGPELVAAIVAVVAEGAISVVLPVPRGRRDGAYVDRMLGVWADCEPVVLLETAILAERRRAFQNLAGMPSETIDQLGLATPVFDPARPAPAQQPVFLQYTSGSTKSPRGVIVTAQMLEVNCRQAAEIYGDVTEDIVVSWVPLYHDMGLMTAVMRPLAVGYTSVLQEPAEFVVDPLRWLKAMSSYRGTLSSAPDFAYAHCARRLAPADLAGLDLSGWRVARSAGEVVRPETMDAFLALTADAGFSSDAFCPSYGMAEATLTVTTTTPSTRPLRIRVDGDRLADGDTIALDPHGRELLSSGEPLPGTSVRVSGSAVDGLVGELQVHGPQVAPGYFTSPIPRTAEGGIRTGDLGFVVDGQVFVLGRRDDVLIVNGVNCFQQDLVAACAGIEGVRTGRIAAFVDDRDPSRQAVVLIVEAAPDAEPSRVTAEVRARVLDAVGLLVSHVELVGAGELPVTTSGKVRVSTARAAWMSRHVATDPLNGDVTMPIENRRSVQQ